jgi:quercetin dioxygenase-like cupin family protein
MMGESGEILAGKLEDLPVLAMGDQGGTEKRIVFGPGRFWDDYVARFFTTHPGSSTPFHEHDWPHYILILEGNARAVIVGNSYELSAGSWAYVPPNTEHVFQNTGEGPLKFICIVPKKGDTYWIDNKGSC